jgi:outer membrane lipoprotein-sorting protein
MVDQKEYETDDRLERATGAIRDTLVPDGPLPHIIRSTIEAIEVSASLSRPAPPRERRLFEFRVVRYAGIAAVLMVLVFSGVWFFSVDRSAAALYAAAQENVKLANVVSYSHRGKVNGNPLASYTEYISGDRMLIRYESPYKGSTDFVDFKQRKGLILNPERKLAFEYSMDEKTATETKDRMSQLLELLKSKDARKIGTERINGREVVAYQVTVSKMAEGLWAYPGATNIVRVDPETKLPVKVEIKWPNGDYVLCDSITWNEKVSPDLFEFHVPQGYHIKTSEERLKEEEKRVRKENAAANSKKP